MIIYKDVFSGDELLTDAFKLKVVDDVFYEVEGKLTTEKTVIADAMIGGNKSAEDEGGEDADDAAASGIDVVLANKLRELSGTKKDFKTGVKKYVQKLISRLEETNPDEVSTFKAASARVVASILRKYDDIQLFCGESLDADPFSGESMFIFVEYRDNKPYLLYFKHGLLEEKM